MSNDFMEILKKQQKQSRKIVFNDNYKAQIKIEIVFVIGEVRYEIS